MMEIFINKVNIFGFVQIITSYFSSAYCHYYYTSYFPIQMKPHNKRNVLKLKKNSREFSDTRGPVISVTAWFCFMEERKLCMKMEILIF